MIFGTFENEFAEYIEKTDKASNNYMVSPLSLKFALALAILGAKNDTKEGLMKAADFKSEEEMKEWAKDFMTFSEMFNSCFKEERGQQQCGLHVANSIWKNTDLHFSVKKQYKENVKNTLSGDFREAAADKMAAKINGWVSRKTKQMIRNLLPDDYNMTDVAAVLVNTLYLKDIWTNEFFKSNTREDIFTDIEGNKTTKEFMYRQQNVRYYRDEKSSAVILPMWGNIGVAFVMGDSDNVTDIIDKADYRQVKVTIPKFEIETTLESELLNDFVKKQGAYAAFDRSRADFGNITEKYDLFISDIIQKTKIKLNEDGLEAAAATAIMMKCNAFFIREEPEEFKADRPFGFYIFTEEEKKLLFFGRVNR